jgi:hypothetical protein
MSVALTKGGMPIPDTLYAMAGDSAIAYQVFRSGEHRVVALTAVIRVVKADRRGLEAGLLDARS